MHLSTDALGFQVSFAIEPRSRPLRSEPSPSFVAQLRTRLALAGLRAAEPRLEDFGAAKLADVGLPPEWGRRLDGRSLSVDLASRSFMPF